MKRIIAKSVLHRRQLKKTLSLTSKSFSLNRRINIGQSMTPNGAFQSIRQLNHSRLTFDCETHCWKYDNESNKEEQSVTPQTVLLLCKIRNNDSLLALSHMAHYCITKYRLRIIVESHVLEQLLASIKGIGSLQEQRLSDWKEYIYTFDVQDVIQREQLKEKVDYMICAGGDGTVLYLHSLFNNIDMPPLLPFVIGGSLGFLLHHDLDHYKQSIDMVMNNELTCTRRMRLQVSIMRQEQLIKQYTSLNEVSIHRGISMVPVIIKELIENSYCTTLRGDGIIVSTPSGSTAYNLSANGPMIHPALDCIVVTPICPNIPLSMRSVVLPATVKCYLELLSGKATVSFDSFDSFEIAPNDKITVSKSPFNCSIFDTERGVTDDWMRSITKRLEFSFKE